MSPSKDSVKVAVVQAVPFLFDKEKTVEKACELIEEPSNEGADRFFLLGCDRYVTNEMYNDHALEGFDFDVVGYYSRPDIFELKVNEKERKNVRRKDHHD